MRGLIFVLGLFNIVIGLGFLLNPVEMAAAFAIAPLGVQGLSTLRADFAGFFLGAAVFAIIGAWRATKRPLLVPVLLLALAFSGRIIGIIADGMTPTTATPMLVEAGMLLILLLGYRSFKR